MTRNEFNELLKIIDYPLSELGDMSVVGDILKMHKPKNVLELGVGNGDWLIFAAANLKDSSVNLAGFENFSWLFNETWPENIEALNKRNTEKLQQLNLSNQITIINHDIETLPDTISQFNFQKFDVVRLDCLCMSVPEVDLVIDAVMPYTTENCIFLVDDILPSYCPNRFLSFMERVKNQELKPLWFGEKEGAWVKPSFPSSEFVRQLEPYFNEYWYTGQICMRTFYDIIYEFLTTRCSNRGYLL